MFSMHPLHQGQSHWVWPLLPAPYLELRCVLEGMALNTDRTGCFLLSPLSNLIGPYSVTYAFANLISQSVNGNNNIPRNHLGPDHTALEIFTIKIYIKVKWHYHCLTAFIFKSDKQLQLESSKWMFNLKSSSFIGNSTSTETFFQMILLQHQEGTLFFFIPCD